MSFNILAKCLRLFAFLQPCTFHLSKDLVKMHENSKNYWAEESSESRTGSYD